MALEDVTAKTSEMKEEDAITVQYEFGGDLDGAVDKFGADTVYNRFKSAVTIDVQSLIRRGIAQDKSPEEIQAMADEYIPGVTTRKRKTKKEKVLELLSEMSEEERAAFIEENL